MRIAVLGLLLLSWVGACAQTTGSTPPFSNCFNGQKYTQVGSPNVYWKCSGNPPTWAIDTTNTGGNQSGNNGNGSGTGSGNGGNTGSLTSQTIVAALGYSPVSPTQLNAAISNIPQLTSSGITTALGFAPVSPADLSTALSGVPTVSQSNVLSAIGYTPVSPTQLSGAIAAIPALTSSTINTALGYTPVSPATLSSAIAAVPTVNYANVIAALASGTGPTQIGFQPGTLPSTGSIPVIAADANNGNKLTIVNPDGTNTVIGSGGGGTGSGTVNSGASGNLASYPASGTAVGDSGVSITDLAKYQAPNSRAASYTVAPADTGNTVVMNCSSACTVTLPAPTANNMQVAVSSIGSVVPTVGLAPSINFNSAAAPPMLSAHQTSHFYSDGTNWFGDDWSTISGKIVNGVGYTKFYPGSSIGARAAACFADVKAGVISTGECSSYGEPVNPSQTTGGIVSQLNIGDATNYVLTWRLPPACNWPVYITDGTSSAVQQFGKTKVISDGQQRGACNIINYSPANGVKYLYLTNTYNFVTWKGISLRNAPGQGNTLAGNAVMEIQQMADVSSWEDFGVASYVPNTTAIDMSLSLPICCSANFHDVDLYGNDTGGIMLNVVSNNALQGIQFDKMTIGHSALPLPLINIVDNSGIAQLEMTGVYEEGTVKGTNITGYSLSGGVISFTTATNTLTAGQTVDISAIGNATLLAAFNDLARNANVCTVLASGLSTTGFSIQANQCSNYAALNSTEQAALQATVSSATDTCFTATTPCTVYPMTLGYALNVIQGGSSTFMSGLRFENIQSTVQNWAPYLWKIKSATNPGSLVLDAVAFQHGVLTKTAMVNNANLATPNVGYTDAIGVLTSYRSGESTVDTLHITKGIDINGVPITAGGGGGGGGSIATDTPPWLQQLGTAADGAFTASGTTQLSGDKYYTNFTVPNGSTVQVNAVTGLTVHATGTCLVAGTINARGNDVASVYGIGGGSGGGGGGGAAVGGAGKATYWNLSLTGLTTAGGGAGGTVGAAGTAGNTPNANQIRGMLASGGGFDGAYFSGGTGGQGGSTGALGGVGGTSVHLICQQITGTDGTNTGTIDVSGASGANATANSTGAGGGGGAGDIILSSRGNIPTLPNMNMNGGAAGTTAFTTSGAGAAGATGWNAIFQGW